MRHHIEKVIIILCCLLACALNGGRAFAQASTKSAGKTGTGGTAAAVEAGTDDVKLKKLIGLGAQALVKTPEFRTSGMGGKKPPSEWVQITARFDTTPEWIDELVFQFYALAVIKDKDGKEQYSFYSTKVTCTDVEKGRDHLAVAYIRPSTLKRYGQLAAIGVEVVEKGKTITGMSEPAPKDGNIADAWWKKEMNSSVAHREGCLLDRSLTPFALINIDDYEVTK